MLIKEAVGKVWRRLIPVVALVAPLAALPSHIASASAVLLCAAALNCASIKLVRAESPEEQARAQRVIVGCVIGGVLMAVAQPLAEWIIGQPITNLASNLPTELVSAVSNLLNLIRYIGIAILIGGLIYGGIQLRCRRAK